MCEWSDERDEGSVVLKPQELVLKEYNTFTAPKSVKGSGKQGKILKRLNDCEKEQGNEGSAHWTTDGEDRGVNRDVVGSESVDRNEWTRVRCSWHPTA